MTGVAFFAEPLQLFQPRRKHRQSTGSKNKRVAGTSVGNAAFSSFSFHQRSNTSSFPRGAALPI